MNSSSILISNLKPAFSLKCSVSLTSEENVELLELEASEGEEPYLTLDLIDNWLILKYSNVALKSQVNDSSFYVDISQLYSKKGKVGTNRLSLEIDSCLIKVPDDDVHQWKFRRN